MFTSEPLHSVEIVFLKRDFDSVVSVLNSFKYFHMVKSSSETSISDEEVKLLADKTRRLSEKARFLMENVKPPSPMLKLGQHAESLILTASSWQELIDKVDFKLTNFEKEARKAVETLKEVSAKKSQLTSLKFILAHLSDLNLEVGDVRGFRELLDVTLAIVKEKDLLLLEQSLAEEVQILKTPIEKGLMLLAIFSRKTITPKVVNALRSVEAKIVEIPEELPSKTDEAFRYIEGKLERLAKAEEEAKSILNTLREKHGEEISALSAAVNDLMRILAVRTSAEESRMWMALRGYVPSRDYDHLVSLLSKELQERVVVLGTPVRSPKKTPVLYRYPFIIKVFEDITQLYGYPTYREINPTPFLALTFPLLFGLMFGDLGHGIILAVGSYIFYKLAVSEGLRRFAAVLTLCGIFSAVAGALYGEVFGFHLFPPILLSPVEDALDMVIISLWIGVIHIALGMAIDVINKIRERNLTETFITAIPKLGLFLSGVALVVTKGLTFTQWKLTELPVLLPLVFLAILFFGKPALHAYEHGRAKVFITALGEQFFEVFDVVLKFISNTVSYVRIFALAVAHWSLLFTFYILAELVSGVPLGFILYIIVAVSGNLLTMFLEGIIVFAHTLRLHFYEWFSKFFTGEGVPFTPFELEKVALQRG